MVVSPWVDEDSRDAKQTFSKNNNIMDKEILISQISPVINDGVMLKVAGERYEREFNPGFYGRTITGEAPIIWVPLTMGATGSPVPVSDLESG